MDTALPAVSLKWEYLGASGWTEFSVQDSTSAFRVDGSIQFDSQPCVEGKVNGKTSYWVRATLVSGNYGVPLDYVAVDPTDPTKGFQVKPGTGNLTPPIIDSLRVGYDAHDFPEVVTQNGFLFASQSGSASVQGFMPFVAVPDLKPSVLADSSPAFYLGFDEAFPGEPLRLYVATMPRSANGTIIREVELDPLPATSLPALAWEYFNGTAWRKILVVDQTNNFTESGAVEFLSPTDWAPLAKFDLTPRHWIRATSSANDPAETQELLGVFLNTVNATEGTTIYNEIAGSSTGLAGQTFTLRNNPLLAGAQVLVREPEVPSGPELAAITAEEGTDAVQSIFNSVTGQAEVWVRWHEVASFLASDASSRHYTLDHALSTLSFGGGMQGLIPPEGTNNIRCSYRTGSGAAGNVPAGAIAKIKSALAGVAGVANPIAADGGADTETVPMVKQRGPQTLRHGGRAVSPTDLEWLARQADGTRIARSRCLPNINQALRFEPGWATLIVVPQGTESRLSPGPSLIRQIENYLLERAFTGLAQTTPARLNVIGPGYIQIVVEAEIVPEDLDQAESVKSLAADAITAFLHPLTGGPDGSGWIFGRDVFASEIYRVIEGVPGVDHVQSLLLYGNVAQCRLIFQNPPTAIVEIPEMTAVGISGPWKKKQALLADTVPAGTVFERVGVKGFREGDRIAKVFDLKVTALGSGGTALSVAAPNGTAATSDATGFPLGSVVTSSDGSRQTRLQPGIPPGAGVNTITVEDAIFLVGDIITVFNPFPMVITSITEDTLALTVESTVANTLVVSSFSNGAVAVPAGSVVRTADGTSATRLTVGISANQSGNRLTQLAVADNSFSSARIAGDALVLQLPTRSIGVEPFDVIEPGGREP